MSDMWPTPVANSPSETTMANTELVDKDGKEPTHYSQRLFKKETGRMMQKDLYQAVLFSSQEDSPASPSATQEREAAQKMTGISGRRCYESLPSFRRSGLSERMLLDCSRWTTGQLWSRYLLAWTAQAIARKYTLFRLAVSERRTAGNDSGLWRTVHGMSPDRKSQMWITPNASFNEVERTEEGWEKRQAYTQSPAGLSEQIRNWDKFDTPISEQDKGLLTQAGSLNPDWVESLMGYPVGWTDIDGPQRQRVECGLAPKQQTQTAEEEEI